jgi:hypothetical protein
MAGIVSIENLKGLGDIVPGISKGISDLANGIRTAITGVDIQKQADLLAKLTELDAAAQNAQTELDKVEAASSSKFVAGWRPFVGWICGCALGFQYIIRPLALWFASIAFHVNLAMPALDLSEMMPVLIGMLGLGTMRTVEKIQGAQGNH